MNKQINELLDEMNEQQKYAANFDNGSLIVLAGPGSGKTKTIITRIAFLLETYKHESFKILCLTFSRNAANEMLEKIRKIIDEEQMKRLNIGTFHSFCLDILKGYGHYIDLDKNFIIYERDEEYLFLLKNAVNERINDEKRGNLEKILSNKFYNNNILDNTVKDYYYHYVKLKKMLIFPEDLEINKENYSFEFIYIYKLYIQALKKNSVLDFNDLIYYTIKLFKEKPFLLERYQRIYKYIMVDEGQDTVKNQFELLKIFSSNNYKNIFVVADEDQLIYEWNDAKFEYLIDLQKEIKSEIVQLFINYRCAPQIIDLANILISKNKNRMENKRKIISHKKEYKDCIYINKFYNFIDEIKLVISKIEELKSNNVCIIARNKFILDEYANYFDQNGINYYKTYNSSKYYTEEVQFLINFMYLLTNEDDLIHFNYLCEYSEIEDNSVLLDISNNTLLFKYLNAIESKHEELFTFINKYKENKLLILNVDINKLFNILNVNMDLNDDQITSDIIFLKNAISRYKSNYIDNYSISDFLTGLAISPKPPLEKGIALMTGYGAKGLEFENVFIVSLNQDIWPDYRTYNDSKKIEEERRNLFVAITRAKSNLFLSYLEVKRLQNSNYKQMQPSQFLFELNLDFNQLDNNEKYNDFSNLIKLEEVV